ncbi:hypothetical protein [Chryseobacterium terrae]|uniref:DUF5050 domain-containing protein n=1 Tax=Chryseobacterium terrae TaxID=3163299 RepID=A0ABW8Y1V5_9FLAO
MKNLIIPFILLLTLIFSCRENDMDEGLEKNTNSVNLYIAGAENNEACYWKNGQKVVLQNGNGLYAHQIIAENNNIYVFGSMTSEYTSSLPSKHHYLWKNGIRYNLDEYLEDVPDPGPNSNFGINSKMIVKNGDIYFSGYVTIYNASSTLSTTSYYFWKNGIKTLISNDNNLVFSTSYSLINNEIYFSIRKNYQYNPITWETGFFKSNTYFSIDNDSDIKSYHVDNTGTYVFIKKGFTNQKYLKNIDTNAIMQLPTNPPSEILNIIWEGNDKYYIGSNFYYKNNTLVQLNDPNGYNRIGEFYVKDQQIYTIRYKEILNFGDLAKVFINNTEVQSQIINSVSAPDVNGLLSISVD